MDFWASEFGRVKLCPASKTLQKNFPQRRDWTADEGSAAHKVCEIFMRGNILLSELIGREYHGVVVDQEMVHNCAPYVEHCLSLGAPGGIEEKYRVQYGAHQLAAKMDFWAFDYPTRTLSVIDFKYGHGWVEAENNAQLICGALCLTDTLPELATVQQIAMTIVQPRASHPGGPVRTWTIGIDQMRNERNGIENAMRSAAIDSPWAQSGDHCRYCRAMPHCHSNRQSAALAIDVALTTGYEQLTPETAAVEISTLRRASTALKLRLAAVEQEAIEMQKTGHVIPGWEMRTAWGRLVWKGDAVSTGDVLGADLRKPPEAITPTQAEDRKILTGKQVAALAERKPGAPGLKETDIESVRRILNGRK